VVKVGLYLGNFWIFGGYIARGDIKPLFLLGTASIGQAKWMVSDPKNVQW
jgi:hypothetical protein